MRSVNLQVHTDDIQTAAMNDLLSLVCETYQVSACLRFLCVYLVERCARAAYVE